MNTPRFGARPQEWDILSAACGLTRDLLPVVSNPDAPISPTSDMKFKGKTPSLYNRNGQVTGISNWTTHISVTADVRAWREEPDYGVCVQTRKIRALDLDVSDAKQVAEIEKFVRAVLGKDIPLAVRRRSNSAKCLIAFEVTGIPADQDLYKRTVQVKGSTPEQREMIEFLATGQQFIAYGTHPSGVRYEWENEGEFPEIPLHVFESLWERLCKRFGQGEPTSSAARKRGAVLAGVSDRIINQLEDKGLVLGWGKDGQAHIECPFSAEHTTESALSATSYFPAGSGGYELGHFSCLHAHCEHRTDQEFMDKLAIHHVAPVALMEMTEADPDYSDEPILPAFKRNGNGQILPTAKNIELALTAPHACGYHIARDTFLEEVMLRPWDSHGHVTSWRRLVDEDYMRLRIRLESFLDFQPVPTGTIREVLHAVAAENQFDSAHEFVNSLKWDGVPRVERFFTDYIKTADPKFGRAVARYLFTALAGRALQPGVQADMAPILIGAQGLGKSRAVGALAPIPDVFVDFNLAADDEKRVRLIKGKLIAEMGEMRGLWGSQVEDIKAFIARDVDHWVPKYKEQAIYYPRRCIFIGTGNNHDILNDPTGSRRFLPMTVVGSVDVDAIKRDCVQLWAEGAVLFKTYGVLWQDAQAMGRDNNAAYTTEDPWLEIVKGWLEQKDVDGKTVIEERGAVSTADVLVLALGMRRDAVNSGVGKRVGEVMRSLGFTRTRVRLGSGEREYMWAPSDVAVRYQPGLSETVKASRES